MINTPQKIKTSRLFPLIHYNNKRVIVNEGSARSTKTYSICQSLIAKGLEKPRIITFFRSRLTWCKATIMLDFFYILINHFNKYNSKYHNKSDCTYIIPFNNNQYTIFRFMGLDETQKMHGYKGDIAVFNEAMEVKKKDYQQVAIRTTEQILLDYNPSQETHWIFDSVIPREDCTFIKSTYKDNPFLEQGIIDEIERLEPTEDNIKKGTADKVAWEIYGKGNRAMHKGLIFGDVKIVKEMPPLEHCRIHGYGLDFGFTNDPSVLIDCRLSQGELYFDEIFYKKGLTNIKNEKAPNQNSIEAELEKNNIPKNVIIGADSAEPKSIQDIQNCGYYIQGAPKGQDSVINGIENLKRYPINITERSLNLIKEKNNYKWDEDKDGKILNKPKDIFNHCWDSCRYWAALKLKRVVDENRPAIFPGEKKKLVSTEHRVRFGPTNEKVKDRYYD